MYGLTWAGLTDEPMAESRLAATSRAWPTILVEQRSGRAPEQTDTYVGPDNARLDVADRFRLDVHCQPLGATVIAPRSVSSELLVHPLSAFVAAAAARWTGRTALHGAAFSVDGRTMVAMGPPAAGKSTLALTMALRGHQVLADDLVVIDGGVVLAGPPIGDLREDVAATTGRGRKLTDSLGRDRYREDWTRTSLESPLAAVLTLTWGDDVAVTRLPVADRLRALGENEALGRGPSREDSFLHLLRVPFFSLERPKDWLASPRAAAALEDLASLL